MGAQFRAALQVIVRPRKTLTELPDDRLYLLAVLSPLYFGYARVSRQGVLASLAESTGSQWAAAVLVLLPGLLLLPVGGLLMKGIVRLFGKRLTVVKLLNLYGYASFPRLLLAIPASVYMATLSEDRQLAMASGQRPGTVIVLAVLGGGLLVYSIVLYIMGIVASPSVDRPEEAG